MGSIDDYYHFEAEPVDANDDVMVTSLPTIESVTSVENTDSRGPLGAAAYISVVIFIYALPIMFFLGVYIFHRSSSKHAEKREMDRQVEKFVEHTIQMQDSWSRDTFKRLKHNIIPVVANSKAKELIERRPSCMAFLHGSNFSFDKFSVAAIEEEDDDGEGGASTSLMGATSLRPDDGYHVEVQNVLTRDLRSVTRMTRIIEEDASVEWAAQVSDSGGDVASTSANLYSIGSFKDTHRGANVASNDTDAAIPPPDDSEHRIWIPLSLLPQSTVQSQSSTAQAASEASTSHATNKDKEAKAKAKAKRGLQNAAGIVKFWKSLVADKNNHAGSSKVMPRDAPEAGGSSSSSTGQRQVQGHTNRTQADTWGEAVSTEALLVDLRRVDTVESHVLFVSEASSGSDRASDSEEEDEDAHESSRALIGDGDDVSLLMRDNDVTDSELASLTWSDDVDDVTTNERYELLP